MTSGQNAKSADSVSHAVFRDTIFEMNHLFAESQEHHRTGFQLLSEGSYAKAREQFLKAIEKNPDWHGPTWVSDRHSFSKTILT
jgi:hypothetical protein